MGVSALKEKRSTNRIDDIYNTIEGKSYELKVLNSQGKGEMSARYALSASAMLFERNLRWGGFANANNIDVEFFALACDMLGRGGAVKALSGYSEDAQGKLLANEGEVITNRQHANLKRAWDIHNIIKNMEREGTLDDALGHFEGGPETGRDLYSILHGSIADAVNNHEQIDPALRTILTKIVWWCSSNNLRSEDAVNEVFKNLKKDLNSYSDKKGGIVGMTKGTFEDIVKESGTRVFDLQLKKVEENVAGDVGRPVDEKTIAKIPKIQPVFNEQDLLAQLEKSMEGFDDKWKQHVREGVRRNSPNPEELRRSLLVRRLLSTS
ncbi:MAG: hypothetical protein ABIG39_07610 [Candidatus Micrarchaeota archaeon]